MKRAILYVSLYLAAAPVSWGAEVPFSAQQVISTAADLALSVFAADLDGDGDLDVLSASGADDKIAWYENTDGAGAFGAQLVISTVSNVARAVYAADLDRDGDMDVVSGASAKIAWYENLDGAGSFGSEQVISSAVGEANGLYAADLDGDGDLDLLSASTNDDKIAWYENRLNDGIHNDFNPSQLVISFTAEKAWSVYAADLDGDGDQDVLSASIADDKIAWYENDGASPPSFTERVITEDPDGSSPLEGAADRANGVFAADLDGDGDQDVLSSSRGDDKIAWYENTDGAGSFSTQKVISSVTVQAASVHAADVDGDGDLDVLSASISGDTRIAWYENTTGTGLFSLPKVISLATSNALAVIAADVDGDGDQDILSASSGDDKIAWYENLTIHRSALFPQQSITSTFADFPVDIIAADVDGDGDMDALAAFDNDNLIAWYENLGGIPLTFMPHSISSVAMGAQSVHVADIDGDGDLDVLSASQADDKIAWYANNGLAVFGAPNIVSATADGASAVFAADLDGDGDVDVLSASQLDGRIVWYESDGTFPPLFTDHLISNLAAGAVDVFAVDLDGDGDLDVLSASQDDVGGNRLAWYENTDGAGTFGGQQLIPSTADGLSGAHARDLDGDGDVDVLSTSFFDNRVTWYENDGWQSFTEHVISTSASAAASVYASDLDGDGDVDVLSASLGDDKVAWYENDGASPPIFAERIITQDPDGAGPLQGEADLADTVFAADMDSDGAVDVLSVSSLDDKVAWYQNRGGQFALAAVDRAQKVLLDAQVEELFSVELFHRGRAGDSDAELAALEVKFEEAPADPLTSGEANALFDELRAYLDDGSGSFEPGIDSLLVTVETLVLTGGVQTLSFPFADPRVQVPFGSTKKFFVVVRMAGDASSQTPNSFEATQRVRGFVTYALQDIPLAAELAADVSTGPIDTLLSTASCTAPFDLNLANTTVSSAVTCQAGTAIRVGPAFVVAAPGDLTFQAGQAVELKSGFEVKTGAGFTAEIDPGLQP